MNYKKDLFFVIGLSFSVNVYATCLTNTPQHGMVQCNYTAPSSDLSFISKKLFFKKILFIGFVVTINERILEVFTAIFRWRTKLAIKEKANDSSLPEMIEKNGKTH